MGTKGIAQADLRNMPEPDGASGCVGGKRLHGHLAGRQDRRLVLDLVEELQLSKHLGDILAARSGVVDDPVGGKDRVDESLDRPQIGLARSVPDGCAYRDEADDLDASPA
jgi:hypothetical protein